MTDTKYDKLLRDFLEADARDRADGNTIANLRLEQHQLRNDMQEVVQEQRLMKLRLDRHGRDIREIKQRLDFGNDDFDTGVHQVEDLKRHLAAKEAELRERRDSGIWWRRQKWQWAMAAVGAVAAGIVGGTATIAWHFLSRAFGGK